MRQEAPTRSEQGGQVGDFQSKRFIENSKSRTEAGRRGGLVQGILPPLDHLEKHMVDLYQSFLIDYLSRV